MLAAKLFKLRSFQRQFDAILVLSVCRSIPGLVWQTPLENLIKEIDWNNMLGIASVLCLSENNAHLDAALRIAQTCLIEECNEAQKSAAAVILENLTNKPALSLAIQRGLIEGDYKDKIPLPFLLETARTNIENSITIKNELLQLNKFQKRVHDIQESNEVVSISAPTSAGKSFILYHVVVEELIKQRANIIYIVPTRALISQVEGDLRTLIKKYDIQNVNVSTVPQFEDSSNSNLFVFTQERLHWFLLENSSLPINYLIIDEAHKIDDGNRGILLQQKIEAVVELNPELKICYSSPFTSNPEILYEDLLAKQTKKVVDTQFISVNQNLLFVSQVPRKVDQYFIRLITSDSSFDLGTVILKDRPGTADFKKLAFLCEAVSSSVHGSLIYSNGPADAEKISMILFDLLGQSQPTNKIQELIKLVKKTVHSEYSLGKVLEKGIAFHYGNMPLLIRQEIEQLFKEGDIKYLVCTSTLLEGVNLPSKSIFIRKPTRGRAQPLNENDFWNLAGRAGRWGKEFSGNIVCIDPSNWEIKPNPEKQKQKIVRAIDKIKDNSGELISFIQNGTPRELAYSRQDLEFAFGYYYIRFLDKKLDENADFDKQLLPLFMTLANKIHIPDYIIRRNPGTSVIAQQSLFEYFSNQADKIETLIPVYPEDANGYNEYSKLVGIIGSTISYYPSQLNNPRAILLINWMQGRPLSYLIASSYRSYQSNPKFSGKMKLPTVIRNTMDDVENFVRFRFAKDSSCYIDVLRYFLELNKRSDLLKRIPDLSLWLEFGVSQKTHLSLLALGLTRNSVIEISGFITGTELGKAECLQWLRNANLEQLNLSPIIIEDVKKAIT